MRLNTSEEAKGRSAPESLRVLLLAGGVTRPPIEVQMRRSALALQVAPDETLLSRWVRLARRVSSAGPIVLSGEESPHQLGLADASDADILADRESYRGPGGVVRDAVASLPPEVTTVLVAEARRLVIDLDPITAWVEEHQREAEPIGVLQDPTGRFAGMYLIDRALLEETISPVGFIDLKEQWLTRMARQGHGVRVSTVPTRASLAIRSRERWLEGVRSIAQEQRPSGTDFTLVCRSAEVASEADVRNSIVLPDARVAPGAKVIGSVIGSGVHLGANARIVDRVLV